MEISLHHYTFPISKDYLDGLSIFDLIAPNPVGLTLKKAINKNDNQLTS